MKQFWNDNRGISYSIVTIFVILAYMSVFWIALGEAVNTLSAEQDKAVDGGTVTEQTQKYYNLSVNLFKSTILFGIIGLVLWGVRKSKFDSQETSNSMFPLFSSTSIMLILAFVSVILVFSFAHPLDLILMSMVNTGLLDHADVYEENNFLLLDMFYLSCIMPAIVGIAIHLLTSVEKISYSMTERRRQFSNDYYVPEE